MMTHRMWLWLLLALAAVLAFAEEKTAKLANVGEKNEYPLLPRSGYQPGVILQILVLVIMFITLCKKIGDDLNKKNDEVSPMSFLREVFCGAKGEFYSIAFTAVAYIFLDGCFEPLFSNEVKIAIYDVFQNGQPTYGVIAAATKDGSAIAAAEAAAQAEATHFDLYNPECHDKYNFWGSTLAMCNDDPKITMNLYFGGVSRFALSFAFLVGCVIQLYASILQLLLAFEYGNVILKMYELILPADNEDGSDGGWGDRTQDKLQEAREGYKKSDWWQTAMDIVLAGQAYGLMFMVLEVQYENYAFTVMTFMPAWFSGLMTCTMLTLTVFLVIFKAVFLILHVTHTKVHPWLTKFFLFTGISMIIMSIISFVYSIVVGVYMAVKFPNEHANWLGCLAAFISLMPQMYTLFGGGEDEAAGSDCDAEDWSSDEE